MSDDNDAGEAWAWVTRYPDGKVGFVGMLNKESGIHSPLLSTSRAVIESLRDFAKSHAEQSGQEVWLRQYTAIVDHGAP